MRWLLVKDLQILRRSPLLVVLLVAYPVIISVLIGLALSKGPDKPTIAFVNEVPAGETEFTIGGEVRDASTYASELFKSVEPVRVRTRAEAVKKVKDGEVLGALIIPRDATEKLRSALSLSGAVELPTLEVIYNQEDPIKAEFVESTIKARLADANKALSDELTKVSGQYLDILLRGGSFRILGRGFDVLGLQRTKQVLEGVRADLPADDPSRPALDEVIRFAGLAIDNLDLSDEILGAIGEPVKVKRTVLDGASTPLDRFAIAVAVTISLMFVTVLLAAGMLALEREEHAFGRLVRGLVSRTTLVVEKIVLSALCALVVTLLMLGGLSLFVALDAGRAPLWLPALGAGAVAFGAMGVALGALAREVRAASLLAFLMSLPIAFLALVPSGSVSAGLFDVIRVVSAVFPFKASLDAVDAAVNDAGGLGVALAHLAALAAAYAAVARLALRRFA
ncbi:ABC transporter permease [Paraconexibacter sp.]|uniref:ABC transporter permease n=1 Tax=Paraconexibacter sp. TaxID=2949640 RepID=UPI003568D49A